MDGLIVLMGRRHIFLKICATVDKRSLSCRTLDPIQRISSQKGGTSSHWRSSSFVSVARCLFIPTAPPCRMIGGVCSSRAAKWSIDQSAEPVG